MAEYRITAVLDPSGVTAGKAKAKQELRDLDAAANTTQKNLSGAFSGAQLDAAVSKLVSSMKGLESAVSGVGKQSGSAQAPVNALTGTIERMTAAQFRAAGGAEGLAKASKDAAGSQAQMGAALARVLGAVDAEAAELLKLNNLLAEAQRLHAQGAITAEQYGRVQAMVTNQAKAATAQTGSQRIGMQQLGYQVGDVATLMSLGAKPAQIFGSQIGQITQAVQLMTSGTSKFASFLGGPWGIALSVGLIALTPLVAKLFESGDALDKETDKLRKDAEQAEVTRAAKEKFKTTTEGVTQAVHDQREAIEKQILSLKTEAERTYDAAYAEQKRLVTIRETTKALLDQAIAYESRYTSSLREQLGGEGAQGFDAAAGQAAGRVAKLTSDRDANQKLLDGANANLADRSAFLAVEQGKRAADSLELIKRKYDGPGGLIDLARSAATAEEVRNGALARQVKLLTERQRVETETEQKRLNRDRNPRAPSDGVSRYRSREQAIGMAGNEFIRGGYKVSENNQFGGVKENHPGMGNTAHGKYAIDVDIQGASDKSPTPPDIKARYAATAVRYAQRGYRVLWAGQVYEPPDGKTRAIPAGQNQHYGHLHLEAPQTIVGKAVGSGAAREAAAEKEVTVADQQNDFVSSVIDQAGLRGLPESSKGPAAIDKVFQDYKRRFNEELSPEKKKAVTAAITEAEAREEAKHFHDAYVAPLEELRAAYGLTGQAREIFLRKKDEERRKGAPLNGDEEKAIENSVRGNDELNRQNQILEQLRGPLEDYRLQMTAINQLFADGKISLGEYNAMMAQQGAQAAQSIKDLPGVDPGTGQNYADVAAKAEENARYTNQLVEFQTHRDELLKLGIDFDSLEEQAAIDHQRRLDEIDTARRDQQLGAAQDIAGSLLGIIESTVGKQNALYKAMFAVEKAVAIARAIVAINTGIAQAAAIPFPANLGAIASVVAATASIISNIQAVALNFVDGGYVKGPGTGRSDNVKANLSNGEFVVNASATRQNRALLEAVNDGRQVGSARQGVVRAEAAARERPRVQVNNYAGVAVETRENLTTGDVEIMIERGVARHAPRTVARAMQDPSSDVSKSLGRNTNAGRRRD